MAHRFTEAELRSIKEVFSDLDRDGDGTISSQDLAAAMDCFRALATEVGGFFTNETLEEVVREMDTDKDGKVSFEEFVSMLADK